ncbi:MAG: AAA family ATPase [Deltaproteobacteria bacterium HGW-Deltaproteobacteria-14]|nr:MAG: AAA family ATPase [Deltaproteobacteria bacterium HGW-Deltaproteobacteria-14]
MLRLLGLGRTEAVEGLLREALDLMLQVAGAERGYIEAFEGGDGPHVPGRWWVASALSEDRIEAVRRSISRGIIAEAMKRAEIVETLSAFTDPRFAARESVQEGNIAAVLCVPIGHPRPVGVLYLEARQGGGGFGPEVRRLAELFAAHSAHALIHVLQRQASSPDPTAALRSKLATEEFIGRTPALARVLEEVALVAPLNVTVLLTGPSGSGKSEVARLIVRNGPRRDEPVVELNCAAMPDELLESELFGSVPGAHSTARQKIPGKVKAAEHGTLFLDEISELSPRAQAKVLQLVQDRTYYPLGASQPETADVRLIAATHRDLRERVAQGEFREDLFYRLNVMEIALPGLDARKDDIPLLLRAFVTRSCQLHGLPELEIGTDAVAAAIETPWPGNVRELRNAVEGAVIRAHGHGTGTLEREHLLPSGGVPQNSDGPALYDATKNLQRRLICDALQHCGGRVTEAAGRLQVSRSHLYSLISALGIKTRSED